MTADRSYTWAKEFDLVLNEVVSKDNLKILEIKNIEVEEVDLVPIKDVRLFLQRNLNKVGLMEYHKEYANSYLIGYNKNEPMYNCKVLFSGDHVIGINVEFITQENSVDKFESELAFKFSTYKINWTEKNKINFKNS